MRCPPPFGARGLQIESHDLWHLAGTKPGGAGDVAVTGRSDGCAQSAATLVSVVAVAPLVVSTECKRLPWGGEHATQGLPLAALQEDILVQDHDWLLDERGVDVSQIRCECWQLVPNVDQLQASALSIPGQLPKKATDLRLLVNKEVVRRDCRVHCVPMQHFDQLELPCTK